MDARVPKNNPAGSRPDAGRRRFVGSTVALLGVSWVQLQWPLVVRAAEAAAGAMAQGSAFAFLDPAEAADLEAIAARIIPDDDTPGARAAGVIYFIDQAMGGFMAPAADELRTGLAQLNQSLGEDGRRFAQLSESDQDAALTAIEHGGFFDLVRFLTLAGFLCLPTQGGNRGAVGWKLIGFDHRHAWLPPFGHYDAAQASDPQHG